MAIVTTPEELKGLKVFNGDSFQFRFSDADSINDVVDFTQAGKTVLTFPISMSLAKTVEQIQQPYIGLPTSVKEDGSTRIEGDLTGSATMNGVVHLMAKTLGGVVQSATNDQAVITIECGVDFVVDITKASGATTAIEILFSETDVHPIDTTTMTLDAFVTAMNAIESEKGDKIICKIVQGEGTEQVNFEEGSDNMTSTFAQKSISVWRVGALADDYKATLAPYINFIIPKTGDAQFINVLMSNKQDETLSNQYTGVRFLSMNMNFQNSALTQITNQMRANAVIPFVGTPAQARIDDVEKVYSQTKSATLVWVNGERATSCATVTNNFGWVIDIPQNISNEDFDVPLSRYTDSVDFTLMYNEQSKKLFQTAVENGDNISFHLKSTAVKNGIEYMFNKIIKNLDCQPQYPAIADGAIQVTASGCTAVADIDDPYTSLVVATSDVPFDVTYP